MKYSHTFTVHLLADLPHDPGTSICPCGEVGRPGPARAMGEVYEGGDDCPDSMRRHIAELNDLQRSITKAQGRGVEHGVALERATVVRWLRACADATTGMPPVIQAAFSVAADGIETGKHIPEDNLG